MAGREGDRWRIQETLQLQNCPLHFTKSCRPSQQTRKLRQKLHFPQHHQWKCHHNRRTRQRKRNTHLYTKPQQGYKIQAKQNKRAHPRLNLLRLQHLPQSSRTQQRSQQLQCNVHKQHSTKHQRIFINNTQVSLHFYTRQSLRLQSQRV